MEQTWEQMRETLAEMADARGHYHDFDAEDCAAIREALRRADAITAAEDARENVISGTTNRTAPEPPTFDEVRQAFQDSHDASYDPDSPDWRRRIERVPVAGGNRYELDGRRWNTCARCECCGEFGCFVASERCPDCEGRECLLKPDAPNLDALLAAWSACHRDGTTKTMLTALVREVEDLRALVDRAAREDGR